MAFHRILVPLDGSPLAEEALAHALRLTQAFHAQLLLLQVLDVQPSMLEHSPDSPDWRLRRLQAQRYLEGVAERVRAQGVPVEWHLAEGRAAGQIVAFVRDHHIDLLVLSAYGWGGTSEFPFGGTAQKVMATTEASYALIRPGQRADAGPQAYRRILVPMDGSRRAEWAMSLATSIATDETAEIVLLQVVRAPEMPRHRPLTREETELSAKVVECNRREASAYLADVHARIGDGCRTRTRLVVAPHVAETVARIASEERAELIVLTAHGAFDQGDTGVGPTCQAVLRSSLSPVLVLQDVSEQTGWNKASIAGDSIRVPIHAPY